MSLSYDKQPITVHAQLDRLIDRGLRVADADHALKHLRNISYYRLSGYFHYFLELPKKDHRFSPTASFEDAIDLYCFDRDLRILVFEAIEKIEISFRTQLIYQLSHAEGTFWVNKEELFVNFPEYLFVLNKISSSTDHSQEQFVKHYRREYTQHIPPSWISFELLTFQVLSRIYSNLKKTEYKQSIASHYSLNHVLLESWIQTLVYIRNLCAHHCRLWNRELGVGPKIAKSKNIRDQLPGITDQNNLRMYAVLYIINYILNQIDPSYQLLDRFGTLANRFPNINLHNMGSPEGWKSHNAADNVITAALQRP